MLSNFKKFLPYFLVLVYVSGAIGFLFKPSFFSPYTPATLILTSVTFLIFQPLHSRNYVLAFTSVAVIGFLSEWIGIETGLIFGHYQYGNALGYKLLGVPLTISLNWALMVSTGILVASKFSQHKLLLPLITALITTITDFIIEQNASRLDFWYFENGIAGWHNYLGWFSISFLTSAFFNKALNKGNPKIASLVLALQIMFFSTLLLLNSLSL